MTTYKLTTTDAHDGPKVEKTGLTREQAMWALTDLMYGAWEDEHPRAERDARVERIAALAA